MRILDRFFGPPSEARFARRLADAIRRAGETNPIHFDSSEFRLVAAGGPTNVMNLGNLYGEYRAAAPDRRPGILHSFARSWFDRYKEVPELFEDLGPDLLPSLRPRMFYESARLDALAGGAGMRLPHRVLGEHYASGLVYDLPNSMVLVQEQYLAGWETGYDEALEVACDNLREISRHRWLRPAPGVLASPWRDHYDASRLLILADLLGGDEVDGDMVAVVPNRDTLLVTGSDDDEGLTHLVALAEESLKQPRPFFGRPIRFRDGDWEPFQPAPDHPSAAGFRRLLWTSLARGYAEQADLLESLGRRTGDDAYPTGFHAFDHPRTGELASYCVWVEGGAGLLPETDWVHFFRPDGRNGGVVAGGSWDRVTELFGDLMTPLGVYPERYRVEDFPTDAQLLELGRD